MKIRCTTFCVTLLLAVLISIPAVASQSVRVLNDISGEKAVFSVNGNSSGSSLNLKTQAIGVHDVTLGGHAYKTLELPAGDHIVPAELTDDGVPDLPVLTTELIIPDQAGVTVSATYSGFDDISDFDLAPIQPSPSDTATHETIPFTMDNQTYSTDAFYPGNLAEASDPQIMRDVRFVRVTLYPLQYNPVQRVLRVYHDLAISISYDGEVINPKTTHNRYISEGFYPIYKAMFANFNEYLATAEVKRGGYMIICKPALVDTVRAVATWKHQKGYTVRIVSTTEINSNPSINPTQTQIFNYIQNAYQTWEVPPEYVMIVGDQDGSYIVNDWPYQGSYASDNHYACVDGTDYIPDIFIARLSVDIMTEARIALSKILKYEKYPLMRDPEHWIRGYSIAYTYYESSRLTTLWVRQLMMQHGFARVDTSFGLNSDPNMRNVFNNGLGFIQYRGAGSSDGWGGPSWGISDLLSMLNNQKLGIMSPLTCGTGDFYAECFGETWIRMGANPDSLKGGPAYFGVSDHDTHTRWNNPIMVGYFFGMFDENISHFAAAAVRGKMQDWYTFPSDRSGMVQQYFHTYNMLGDPELEIRTKIPIYIMVAHADSVPFGPNHYSVAVTDTLGTPIKDAYVTLIKTAPDNSDEVYSVEKTDDAGAATLSFNAQSTGAMTLTVSGQNLIPFQTDVHIVDSDIAVGLDTAIVDDDNNGRSRGDGDGVAAPGETIELNVSIKNYGLAQTAYGVNAQVESMDETGDVYDARRNLGDLPPGITRTPDIPFVVHISSKATDGEIARFRLSIVDQNNDTWESIIELPIEAPNFVVTRVIIPEGDSVLSPGEISDLKIQLTNRGSLNAQNVMGTVTTNDDYTKILYSAASFGDIAIDSTRDNGSSLVIITCDQSIYEGRNVNLVLHATTQAGAKADVPFTLPVGRITRNDPVGPDAYGYYMYDTKDSAYTMMPTYQWVEISPDSGGHGSRLNYGSETDDKSVLVYLPFDMIYYGQPYHALTICINGFAALDTFRVDSGGNYWANFFNWPIPDPGNAAGQISPFWDDLSITAGGHYGVYTWIDLENHQFYIEWLKMTNNNYYGYYDSFQMIITDPAYQPTLTGDSEIRFVYRTVYNRDSANNYASVGFESYDEMRGLQWTNDNFYTPGADSLRNNSVILISTNTGRGAVRGIVTLDNGSDFSGVQVSTNTGQTRQSDAVGSYWIREVPPGPVDITAKMPGYFPATQDSITVMLNQTSQLDTLRLTRCPIPANLSASDGLADSIEVLWDTLSNANLSGFNIFRSRWVNGEYVKLNSNLIHATQFVDSTPSDTGQFLYYVTAVYTIGDETAESFISNKDSGSLLNPTGIVEENPVPGEFFLSQNYPNPFNPTTTISYGLSHDANVKLDIFNIMGQKIATLVNQEQTAGYKQVIWEGKDASGKSVASGVYFYRIETGNFAKTDKMLLLK